MYTFYNSIDSINMFLNFISKLSADEHQILTNKVQTISPLIKTNYNLVLLGTVSIGKTTICNILYQLFYQFQYNVFCYPEFLQADERNGQVYLEAHLENKLSSFDFQNYILDTWNNMMRNQPLEKNNMHTQEFFNEGYDDRINIFERCCDDSVVCFVNVLNNEQKTINDEEFEYLFNYARKLILKHKIPSYTFQKNINLKIVSNDSLFKAVNDILDIIIEDLTVAKDISFSRFIGLTCDFEKVLDRINDRNRASESNYSQETLLKYYNCYENIYKNILQNGHLKLIYSVKPFDINNIFITEVKNNFIEIQRNLNKLLA